VRLFAVGADAGAAPLVNVYNTDSSLRFSLLPYAPAFQGGVRVATGDVTGDGVEDIVTAPGPAPCRTSRSSTAPRAPRLLSFLAYGGFTGGVFVAAGDVTGDSHADVITGAAVNGHVKVFDGATGQEIQSFLAYGGFPGGVSVAAGASPATAAPTSSPARRPTAMSRSSTGQTGAEVRSFLAYPGFPGGVFVGAGDLDGDGRADSSPARGRGPARTSRSSAARTWPC